MFHQTWCTRSHDQFPSCENRVLCSDRTANFFATTYLEKYNNHSFKQTLYSTSDFRRDFGSKMREKKFDSLLPQKRTSYVHVRIAPSVPRAQEGRAGVAVLGLGRADGQAADLAVRAVHHLHKLTTPFRGGRQWWRVRPVERAHRWHFESEKMATRTPVAS